LIGALLWVTWGVKRFGVLPCRVILPGGAEVVRRIAPRKTSEDPMTKPKSKPKSAARPPAQKTRNVASRKRLATRPSKPVARASTKHDRIIAMLRTPAGATIASLVTATEWQQHSVRGFLAGVVRKKLGLNLVSEVGDKGRVYRIKDGKASPAVAKQAS
jgi:Protein of unknown function (DUF3489)